MYPPHLNYLNVRNTTWFNPCYGYFGFWKEYYRIKEEGKFVGQETWNHRKLKRAKEIYATAIAAMAFARNMSPQEQWWIHKPNQDPPDGVIGTIVTKGDMQEMHVREVEVVENFDGNVEKTILDKLSQKYYEPNTVLVCFVTMTGIVDFKAISDRLSKTTMNLQNIFVAMHGRELSAIPKGASDVEIVRHLLSLTVIQLKPTFIPIAMDMVGLCDDWKRGNEPSFFIFQGRGKGTKNKPLTLDNPPKLF